MMRKQWSVKFHKQFGRGESRSSLSKPRTALGARLVKIFSLQYPGYSRTIVNHDDEVRAWGRHDWVRYPTEMDRRMAEANAQHIIPSVPAGGSIQFEVPLEGIPDDGASETLGLDAK